jgi:hypothetical protein
MNYGRNLCLHFGHKEITFSKSLFVFSSYQLEGNNPQI